MAKSLNYFFGSYSGLGASRKQFKYKHIVLIEFPKIIAYIQHIITWNLQETSLYIVLSKLKFYHCMDKQRIQQQFFV